MLKKIYKEIDDFTSTIKEAKGCDDMLAYMNSSLYATIKLLMFASTTFKIYAKVMLFLIIALTGFLLSVSIGAMALNINILLVVTIGLFISKLLYVTKTKNYLVQSINNKKQTM